jgi:membrane-anchored mycosin MYCP
MESAMALRSVGPRGIVAILVATVIAVGPVLPSPASAAPPAGACTSPDPAGPTVTEEPWAQRTLEPKLVWPYSTGAGVTVAVVDSGVDADHPQLAAPGTVARGKDFYFVGDLPGNFDCVSHGTAVASIIAAAPAEGIGFAGLAPGAHILPVRVTDRDVLDNGWPEGLDPAVLARGIWYAADQGAKVINLSLAGPTDNSYVRDAVAHARSKDALVVAAVGNGGRDAQGPSYPAAYDGVLGVGAVDQTGIVLASSQVGPYVDLVAPGGGVLAATRAGGHRYYDGTSFAAAYVSATAALVRAAWPQLSADEVATRILATASPAPGGRGSAAYGAGLVNPVRAVLDGLVSTPLITPESVTLPPVDEAAVRSAAWWELTDRKAHLGSGLAGGLAALALVCVLAIRRGRRGRWLARRASAPEVAAHVEPPDQIFLLPPPPVER